MDSPSPHDLSKLLQDVATGHAEVADNLVPLVYDQLRTAAEQHMRAERPDHTLGATALVHEAYLRLAGPRNIPWRNRVHFYAAAVEAMRRILLDHAKARGRGKRGGGRPRVDLDAVANMQAQESPPDFVAIDQAICRLMDRDRRAAEVVRLKFYAGLSTAEIALALVISERTVTNDWTFARAWLERELQTDAD